MRKMRNAAKTNGEETAPRASGIYHDTFTVPPDAIDGNGHVNNVSYVQWMQDVAVAHFRSVGGMAIMHDLGATWVVRSHRIEYLSPAYGGDAIEARTWVATYGRVRSKRRYKFVRPSDSAVLARGETDWVFVNAETGKPMAIPDDIRNAFRDVQGGESP
jgi:acyl-CoA thioester hydrolase